MPLDTKNDDLLAVKAVAGCAATFVQRKRGPSVQIAGDASLAERAEETARLWQAFGQMPDADMMIWRRPVGFSAAMRAGGVVLEGHKPFNIGLAKKQVTGLKPFEPKARRIAAPKLDETRRAIWAVADRLGRVQAPRLLEMILGEAEYVVSATRNGFALIDDDAGVEGFRSAIETAVTEKASIEYTLGNSTNARPDAWHAVSSLFDEGEDAAHWRFDAAGWPVEVPAGAAFTEIVSMRTFAACLLGAEAQGSQLDVLNAMGRPVLRARIEAEGVTLTAEPSTISNKACAEFSAWALKH